MMPEGGKLWCYRSFAYTVHFPYERLQIMPQQCCRKVLPKVSLHIPGNQSGEEFPRPCPPNIQTFHPERLAFVLPLRTAHEARGRSVAP